METRIGQQMGNYRLDKLLGRGGFAEVYLGEHVHLGTLAAIKILTSISTEKEIQQFLTEAQTVAKLKHPHIIQVLDFGKLPDKTPYLVMDYAPGGTLRRRYPKGTPLPFPTLIVYVKQIAEALQYAHNQRIIHRDIKPENMLLGENDHVLLSDFGIATFAHNTRTQITQELVGTASYMAPEQIQGKPRPASDQYALGVAVYEWLTGRRPFTGSYLEVISQHLSADPPPFPAQLHLSSSLESVVRKALAKKSEQRFDSVQAFAGALEKAFQQTAIVNEPTSLLIEDIADEGGIIDIDDLAPPPPAFFPTTNKATLPATQEVVLQNASASPSIGKPIIRYSGHDGGITDMAWSPNGQFIASASLDGTINVWEVATNRNIFHSAFEHNSGNYVNSLAWSPDGAYIAIVCSTGIIQIFAIPDGNEYAQYTGGSNSYGDREQIETLKWAPDGRGIAFRSYYSYPFQNSIKVWSMQNPENVISYDAHHAPILSFAWSPNSNNIASSARSVHVWDAATGGRVFTFHDTSNWIRAVTWSPDGRYTASGGDDKTVQIWDVITGEEVFTYRGHKRWVGGKVTDVAWSANGQYIASASDKIIHAWNVTTGETISVYEGHSSRIQVMIWSPDGQRIASIGSNDDKVHVWDAITGQNVFLYAKHSGIVGGIAWSPDGTRIASNSQDKTVQVWQAI